MTGRRAGQGRGGGVKAGGRVDAGVLSSFQTLNEELIDMVSWMHQSCRLHTAPAHGEKWPCHQVCTAESSAWVQASVTPMAHSWQFMYMEEVQAKGACEGFV